MPYSKMFNENVLYCKAHVSTSKQYAEEYCGIPPHKLHNRFFFSILVPIFPRNNRMALTLLVKSRLVCVISK